MGNDVKGGCKQKKGGEGGSCIFFLRVPTTIIMFLSYPKKKNRILIRMYELKYLYSKAKL